MLMLLPTPPNSNLFLRIPKFHPPLSILRTLLKLKTRIWAMANELLRTLPKENNPQKFEKLKARLTKRFMLRVPMACPLGTWAATGTAASVASQRLTQMKDKKRPKKHDAASIAEKLALSFRVKPTRFPFRGPGLA